MRRSALDSPGHYVFAAILVLVIVVAVGWQATSSVAQQGNAVVNLTLSAAPDQLLVGEITTVTLALAGQAGPPCAHAAVQPADVVLVMDVSASMRDEDKLAAAKEAALAFLQQMDLSVDQVALAAFSGAAFTVQDLTQDPAAAQAAIEGLETIDGTDIAAGLQEGAGVLGGAARRPSATAALVLLSDGQSDAAAAEQAAAQIQQQGVVIHTVSLGSDADRALMEALASSPSNYHHAPSAADLSDVYRAIQAQIASAVASNVAVRAGVNTRAFELLPQSVVPAGIVAGDQITWTVGALAAGQTQALMVRLRARQAGTHPALLATDMQYDLCGEPHRLAQGPGPMLAVTAPVPPTPTPIPACVQEPLSNDCLSHVPGLGGLIWPCTALGLPWWVCLLLPLLVLLALLVWLWWRRTEQARQAWQAPPGGALPPPRLDTARWQPLPTPSTPPLLPVVEAKISANLNPTLVLGLGQMGQHALDALKASLEEAYGAVPAQIRWLAVHPVQGPPSHDDTALTMPLDADAVRDVLRAAGTRPELQAWLSPEVRAELQTWLSGNALAPVPPPRSSERALGRLALFVHRHALETRLQDELRALGSDSPTIYLIGSLAEGYASGALLDVAHLTRLQAHEAQMSNYVFQGLLLLPEAHVDSAARLDEQARLQQAASAAWRELDRFQSVFEHPYPLDYGDRQTRRQGRLFDRCYLFSPDRSEGPGLTGQPVTETLCPAIADLILALADARFRPAWGQVAEAVAERTARQQHQRGEALYSSLGSFTYVLPVEDLVQSAALRLAREMVAAQLSGGLPNAREVAVELLSRPASPGGVAGTVLMQDVAQRADLSPEQAKAHVAALGAEVAALLAPLRDPEAQRQILQALHSLAGDGIVRAARTGAEVGADEYGPDTDRFLRDVARAREQVASLDAYLEACRTGQAAVFQRILAERLLDVLNPPQRGAGSGLMAGLDLARALSALLTDYRQAVAPVAADLARAACEAGDQAEALRQSLQEKAQGSRARHPRFGKALLVGVVPAAAAVIGLGLLAMTTLALLLPLGGVALLAAGTGAWATWHVLHRTPVLVRHQLAYRQAAQGALALEVERRLYEAWVQIVERWLEIVSAQAAPLQAWHTAWNSPALAEALAGREAALAERRQARQAIRVRHYLDDDPVREALYQRHVAPLVQKDQANRFVWSYHPGEETTTWQLTVVGTQARVMPTPGVEEAGQPVLGTVEAALLNVGRAYASGLRALRIADALANLYTAEAVAQECGPGSGPLVRMVAHEQPLSEAHRFVAVAGETQTAYFDQVVQTLRQPAAQVHSEQQAALGHPHRCMALASLDLLRNAGLPSWEQGWRSYGNLPRPQRVVLHVFPAERTAAWYEGLLSRIGLAWRVFSPRAALTLEDERRARAFWLACACGWVQQVSVERGGMSPLRQMALVLPGAEPVALTEAREEPPSLWQAAVAYVLGERGGELDTLETALSAQDSADRSAQRAQMRTLERALDTARQWQQERDPVMQELGVLLHLIVEDKLQRLDGQPGILEA